MKISIIAAMGRNRELGMDNKLLWHLSDDLIRFKKTTTGHTIIMGRKTFDSIGRPLPNRKNIIITRNSNYRAVGCVVVPSIEAALKEADGDSEAFLMGGGEIYKLGLPYANQLYLTYVDAELPADTFFPEFNETEWRVVSEERHEKDGRHPYAFVHKVYERISPAPASSQ